MKKLNLLSLISAAIFAAGLFFACTKTVTEENLTAQVGQISLKANTLPTAPAPLNNCETCLVKQADGMLLQSLHQGYTAGPQGSVDINVYQTGTKLIYKITSSDGKSLLKILFEGQSKYASNTPAQEPFIIETSLGNWTGCESRTAKIEVRRVNSDGTGGGQYLLFNTSVKLVPICTTTSISSDPTTFPVCVGSEITIIGTVNASFEFVGGTIKLQELVNTAWQDVAGASAAVNSTNQKVEFTYTSELPAGTRVFQAVYVPSGTDGFTGSISGEKIVTTKWDESCGDFGGQGEQECTSYQYETGFGGNTEGTGNAWWYYYDTSTGGEQTIWAGQHIKAGTVKIEAGVLYITLMNGWELNLVTKDPVTDIETTNNEAVKIQGYNTLPNKRPAAGQFTTYKGNDLNVTLKTPLNTFYVIHLDLQKCKSSETPN
jgi:hypothetical protein